MFRLLPPINIPFILFDVLQLLSLLIFVEVILSWAFALGWRKVTPYTPWVRTLHRFTDPMLNPLRKLLPAYKTAGWDLSPLLAMVFIQVIQGVVLNMIR